MIILFKNKEDCCGCTACKNICPQKAISMVRDAEGFLYPDINRTKCTNCGMCITICPFKLGYSNKSCFEIPIVYAAKHKSESVRKSSSSGGMFVAISNYVLEIGGTVYGAGFDKNFYLRHQRATTPEERDKFKGSKYLQSDLKETFVQVKRDLLAYKHVLFTGTPCQIAGLNSFLGDTDKSKLYLCDIVCHGVPSPLIWEEYKKYLETQYHDKIKVVKFRDKTFGWMLSSLLVVFFLREKHLKIWLTDYYFYLFFNHYILRKACHNCKFTNFNRPSDITIGDFWNIDNCLPDFNDKDGVSLLLINTSKGKGIFENIKNSIYYRESNIKDCLQAQLQYPSKENPKRADFWADFDRKGLEFVLKKYGQPSFSCRVQSKIKGIIRTFLIKTKTFDLAKRLMGKQ